MKELLPTAIKYSTIVALIWALYVDWLYFFSNQIQGSVPFFYSNIYLLVGFFIYILPSVLVWILSFAFQRSKQFYALSLVLSGSVIYLLLCKFDGRGM